MSEAKWYLRTQDETFGPETEACLVEWARRGRILPGQSISDDSIIWRRVEEVPFLDMRFSIDVGDGNPRGPFNRFAAEALVASGRLPVRAKVVEIRPPFHAEEQDVPMPEREAFASSGDRGENSSGADEGESSSSEEAGQPQSSSATVIGEEVEQPELFAPASAGVASEQIAEQEVRVEIPVEKIVEKVVTVVDETRVKELEVLLDEERRHTGALQERLDAAQKTAAGLRANIQQLERSVMDGIERERVLQARFEREMKDAVDRELKLREQIRSVEDELRRLPQAAGEVADIQAAMYSLMTNEARELQSLMDAEKAEAEEFRRRHEARMEGLAARRREMLRRAGANIEEMTRKALFESPEDPRTARLRQELDELRRTTDMQLAVGRNRINELEAELADCKAREKRAAQSLQDVTQLQNENVELREALQRREQDLLSERQKAEETRQGLAARQQAMLARLATLETTSIGTSQTIETNQSREARLVKLPSWMRLRR